LKPSRKPLPKTMPNQEQEQEQEYSPSYSLPLTFPKAFPTPNLPSHPSESTTPSTYPIRFFETANIGGGIVLFRTGGACWTRIGGGASAGWSCVPIGCAWSLGLRCSCLSCLVMVGQLDRLHDHALLLEVVTHPIQPAPPPPQSSVYL